MLNGLLHLFDSGLRGAQLAAKKLVVRVLHMGTLFGVSAVCTGLLRLGLILDLVMAFPLGADQASSSPQHAMLYIDRRSCSSAVCVRSQQRSGSTAVPSVTEQTGAAE